MFKSIQYFNEECAKKFESLENEFIRNPSDLATYVVKITEELQRIGVRMIQETLEDMDEMLNASSVRKKKWVVDRHETKQLITSLGTVIFEKTLFKNKQSGERKYLLDQLLCMGSHERLTDDAVARMLKEAVKTSYKRGGEETSILDDVSKQTVMNKIHELKFPKENEVLKEKRYVKKLYIDADEDHLSLQFQTSKGNFGAERFKRKHNNMIAKLVYVYEGIESETPGSKRKKLINPHYFTSTSAEKDNRVFWEEIYEWIDHHYDLGRIEKIYLNGDGGTWIKAGKEVMNGVTITLDEFHLQKYLSKLTAHLKDSQSDAISELRKIIRSKSKKEFVMYCDYVESYLKEGDYEEIKRVEKSRNYILDNWIEAKMRLSCRRSLPGCSAEGHVSHVLSSRMSSRPMGWSREGAAQMAHLRVYYYNGGDMLSLAKYQRENVLEAAGAEGRTFFTPTEIMKSEENRNQELGKYLNCISGSINNHKTKKLIWFNTHITGL